MIEHSVLQLAAFCADSSCCGAQPAQTSAVHDVEPRLGEVTQRPEVVDDFIRNFLIKMGLTKTLEMFETEWYTYTHPYL